jgi:hypothetical protein
MEEIRLEKVTYIPKELAPGILYVSEEFQVAVHLCACGCGNKVTTPLGPAEWAFKEKGGLPSLFPSIGNWQLPCRTHYVISKGRIRWAARWTDEKILAGRQREERRRAIYYSRLGKSS